MASVLSLCASTSSAFAGGLAACTVLQPAKIPRGRAQLIVRFMMSFTIPQSGLPFNITRGSDVNLDGNNTDRVNVVGNPYLDPHRSRSDVSNAWFSTAAFAAPAAGTDGNLGRNVLDAPGVRNVDLGIFRNFKVRERMTLQEI